MEKWVEKHDLGGLVNYSVHVQLLNITNFIFLGKIIKVYALNLPFLSLNILIIIAIYPCFTTDDSKLTILNGSFIKITL